MNSLRRTPGWKIALLMLAVVVVITGSLYGWFRAAESRRWNEMEATLAELEVEAESRPGGRPVLYGEAVPGNAWDHYERAIAGMKVKIRPYILSEYVLRMPKVDRDQVLQRLAELAPALEDLRRGSRCDRAARRINWRASTLLWLSTQQLASLMIVQAREWTMAGRVHDAVELLLDAARMGADFGSNAEVVGFWVSMAMLSLTLDELKDVVSDRAIGTEDLQLIESGLHRLDRSLPAIGPALMNGAMARGWELRGAPILNKYIEDLCTRIACTKPAISAWRFGFSDRLMIADYVDRHIALCRRMAALDGRPWDEARSAAREADREIREWKNSLMQVLVVVDGEIGQFGMQSIFRERRAQLRLLRVAARYRATGDVAGLEDPFGGMLSATEKDGRLKLWSRGKDGVDDGGTGEWKARAGKDIVLEVPR